MLYQHFSLSLDNTHHIYNIGIPIHSWLQKPDKESKEKPETQECGTLSISLSSGGTSKSVKFSITPAAARKFGARCSIIVAARYTIHTNLYQSAQKREKDVYIYTYTAASAESARERAREGKRKPPLLAKACRIGYKGPWLLLSGCTRSVKLTEDRSSTSLRVLTHTYKHISFNGEISSLTTAVFSRFVDHRQRSVNTAYIRKFFESLHLRAEKTFCLILPVLVLLKEREAPVRRCC